MSTTVNPFAYDPNTKTTGTSASGTGSSSVMGKDDFLKLMITEMQYQDPLNPMDDKDSIAQLAQFTSLEQMTNMSTTMATMQATTMIGKVVTWTDDQGQMFSGMVSSVSIVDGKPELTMANAVVDPKSLTQFNAYKDPKELIGTQVSWKTSAGQQLSGIVLNVQKDSNGNTQLIVSGPTVSLDSVLNVTNPASAPSSSSSDSSSSSSSSDSSSSS